VEWIDADSIARFGTYGRGVWDLQIGQLTSPPDTILVTTTNPQIEFDAYPNPVLDHLTVRSEKPILSFKVVDPSGRIIERKQFTTYTLGGLGLSPKPTLSLNTSAWTTGIYRIEVETIEGLGIQSIVKR